MFDPKQLMAMQKQLMGKYQTLQAEREDKRYIGTAGGGAVTCTMNGLYQVMDLVVKPEAVDPDDIQLLQDLMVAAINQAVEKARAAEQEEMGDVTGGLNLPSFLTGGLS